MGASWKRLMGGKKRTYEILSTRKMKQNNDGTTSNYINNIYVTEKPVLWKPL